MTTMLLSQRVRLNPTVTVGAYGAGDVVGGLLTLPIGTNGAILRKVKIVDDSDQGAELSLYLFNTLPTTIADNAVFASAFVMADHLAIADEPIVFATTDYTTINSNKFAMRGGYNDPNGVNVDLRPTDGNAYAYFVCTATPTYTALCLHFEFYFWPNAG